MLLPGKSGLKILSWKKQANSFVYKTQFHLEALSIREYARGRRERRNRFRPVDVAFFSSESDKNVALIFPQNMVFQYTFHYTHVSSAGV